MAKTTSVILQRNTPTRSATGQEVNAWATYATVYGSVKTLRGAAYYASQQTANQTTVEVYIHYRSDVLASDRAIIGGVTYEIVGPPENIGFKNRELLVRLRNVQ